jgi:antitoxin (DNA-binding transcriptional repressor) of toxin-antitoxin stability system
MKVSVQYAQEHFADILTAIDTAEEVELKRPGKPSLFIAPRPSEPTPAPPKRPRAELLYA